MYLPKVLPNESLFSRICRCLTTSELSPEHIFQKLVEDGRGVIHPYLTAKLHNISQFTEESSEELLLKQTLRPLFFHYLPHYRTAIKNVMANTSEILRASQLSTFRGKESLSIKYCPRCAKNDLFNFGVTYWHLVHQVPGVEACSLHNTWLVHQELLHRNNASKKLLPNPLTLPTTCSKLAQDFSLFVSIKISQLSKSSSKYQDLCTDYRKFLLDNGGLTQSGRVKRIKLTRELFQLSEELFPVKSDLTLKSLSDYRFVSTLLEARCVQHPFKHLLLEFYIARHLRDNEVRFEFNNIRKAHRYDEELCCNLLRAGLSMAAVSRDINRSRCYVKSVALKNNIPVNLRPKAINAEMKQSVIELAKKGFHRKVIADIHGISSGSVELIISTTTGLVEWRKRCKAESLRRRYRCQILRFLGTNSNLCRQDIKNECEAAFYWLLLHEREWLESVLPEAKLAHRVERVDWERRDNELAIKVNELMLSSEQSLTRTHLDRLLGGHGWLTSKIDKLPKTKKLLLEGGFIRTIR